MNRPPGSDAPAPEGDPWAAFGYLVAGVAFYGALGWGLSVWLHADYWIPIGILVGIGLGMYMVFARYRFREPAVKTDAAADEARQIPAAPIDPQHRNEVLQPDEVTQPDEVQQPNELQHRDDLQHDDAAQPDAARRPERDDRGDSA